MDDQNLFDDFMDLGIKEHEVNILGEVLTVAVYDPFSLLPVQARLEAFKAVILAMKSQADGLAVHDQDSAKEAVSLASTAKKKAKEIDAARTEIVGPHNEFVKSVNNLAKDCSGPLAQIEQVLKRKISDYETKARLELAKAQEAANQQAAMLQAEINQNAEAAGVTPPQVVAPILPEAPAVIRTEAGSASQRKEWKFTVVDPQAVPREYLIVDERAIREAVRRGVRQILGVEIFEQTKTIFRT